jgi:tetratricopeptide (TPR) repeat protein
VRRAGCLFLLVSLLAPGRAVCGAAAARGPEDSLVEARALYRRGDAAGAIAALEAALKRHPRFAPAHHLLGSLYLSQGKHALAGRHFRKETQLGPRDAGGYFGLAEVAYRERRYPAAIAALQKVLAIDPQSVTARAKLGVIYVNQVYVDKALQQFQAALKLDPEAHVVHYYLGDLLRKLSRSEGARKHLERAVSLQPNIALYHLSLGQLYLQQQHTPENATRALSALRRALELDPRLANAEYCVGLIYQRQQQWADAERHLRQALAIDPGLGEAHYTLAGVLRRLGKSEEARQHLAAFRRLRAARARRPGEPQGL